MNEQKKRVKVIYDLRVLPPTFDFLAFLAMTDGLRRIHIPEVDGFDLVIVYGPTMRGS